MTKKEKYKQAFSVLHSSGRQFLEVEEMMKVRNLGRKSLEEVMNKLAMMGLSLADDENNN